MAYSESDIKAFPKHIREQIENNGKPSKARTADLRIEIPEVAPMLNGKDGLMRMHWTKRRKLQEKWAALISSVTNTKLKGRVSITYTRSSVTAPDWDNLCASFKTIGDALVKNGVIEDDNPHVVVEFTPKWQKAKNNNDLETIIEISKLS